MVVSRNGSILNDSGSGIHSGSTNYDTFVFIHGEVIARNYGIYLESSDGTTTGVGSHEIVIGATGSVSSMFASQHALYIKGTGNDLINDGTIYSISAAVRFYGDYSSVTNSGLISSTSSYGVYFHGVTAGGESSLMNSGTITAGGYGVYAANDGLNAINTGTIESDGSYAIYIGTDGNALELINYGLVQTHGNVAIQTRDSADDVRNYGTIMGDVNLDEGTNTFVNAGELFGDFIGGDDADWVENSGRIMSDVFLGTGHDVFDGRGGRVDGSVYGGTGDDIYYVSDARSELVEEIGQGMDTVYSEAVSHTLGDNFEALYLLGGGDIDGFGNAENNVISGTSGANNINGHDGADTIEGGADNDTLKGGDGDDNIAGGDGEDNIRGNADNDTISGNRGDDMIRGGRGNDNIQGNDGDDSIRGGSGNDTIRGNDDNDTLRGGRGDDDLRGGADDDLILGGAGNDDLSGGDGNDVLVSGLGTDLLEGGAGVDVFVFETAQASLNDATADRISDFLIGTDLLDLSGMNGSLSFIGTSAFSGGGAEVRYTTSGGNTQVRVDLDGDGSGEIKITLENVLGGIGLADLIL